MYMSIYHRYGQKPLKKTDWTLTADNIDDYLEQSKSLHRDVQWLDTLTALEYRSKTGKFDELYTEEYLLSRISKIRTKYTMTPTLQRIYDLNTELKNVNSEIDTVRPLVFHQEIGKNPEHHARMSDLDDKRKELEDKIVDEYRSLYPSLCENLPKIFFMIVEGCDIETVISCFKQMRLVLLGQKSSESAADELMKETSLKYNLPSTIWDPIRKKQKNTNKKSK